MRIRDGNNRVTEYDMTPPITPPGVVTLVSRARPVLPCERCSHRDVCAIRALIDVGKLEVRAPDSPHEALRIGIRIDVECRHFVEDPIVGTASAWPIPGSFVTGTADAREHSRRGAEASKKLRAAAKPPVAAGGGPGKVRVGAQRHTDDEIETAVMAHGSMEAAGKALGYTSGWAISSRLTNIRARRAAAASGSTEVAE